MTCTSVKWLLPKLLSRREAFRALFFFQQFHSHITSPIISFFQRSRHLHGCSWSCSLQTWRKAQWHISMACAMTSYKAVHCTTKYAQYYCWPSSFSSWEVLLFLQFLSLCTLSHSHIFWWLTIYLCSTWVKCKPTLFLEVCVFCTIISFCQDIFFLWKIGTVSLLSQIRKAQ